MPKGENLFSSLAELILQGFYGTIIIRFEAGRAAHIETEIPRTWHYRDLPEWAMGSRGSAHDSLSGYCVGHMIVPLPRKRANPVPDLELQPLEG
jgi:hypothetical protein